MRNEWHQVNVISLPSVQSSKERPNCGAYIDISRRPGCGGYSYAEKWSWSGWEIRNCPAERLRGGSFNESIRLVLSNQGVVSVVCASGIEKEGGGVSIVTLLSS